MPTYTQNFDRFEIEQYLKTGATSGARNDRLFHIAMLCCWQGALKDYAPRLIARDVADGHTEAEARKTLDSAFSRYQRNGHRQCSSMPDHNAPPVSGPKVTLPPPISGGFTVFMETLFEPSEFVALSEGVWNGKDKFEPRKAQTRKRDDWIDACRKGKLPKSFLSGTGVFVRINPVKDGGSTDADVVAYRYCLVEFDELSLEEQYELLLKSNLPVRTLSFSGDRSLHALVWINAPTLPEYERRRDIVLKVFSAHPVCLKNKNRAITLGCRDSTGF
jgi:hypothetical protein